MELALQIFVPGDPEPLLIDRTTVKWVKGSEFGVDFDTPPPKVAVFPLTVELVKVSKAAPPVLPVFVRPPPAVIVPGRILPLIVE